MERTYQKSYTHRSERKTNSHIIDEDKPIISIKKLIFQTIGSILFFLIIYISTLYNNSVCKIINNEIKYALNYTIDLENVYYSSQEVIKYLAGSIEQGRVYIDNAVSTDGTSNIIPDEVK